MLGDQKPFRAADKLSWVIHRSAEIARGPGAILNSKSVIAAVPLETLVAHSEGISVTGWDYETGRCRATLACVEIEPGAQASSGSLHVVETNIDVALNVAAIFGGDIRAGARQIAQG